jgi:hypothetical protein
MKRAATRRSLLPGAAPVREALVAAEPVHERAKETQRLRIGSWLGWRYIAFKLISA